MSAGMNRRRSPDWWSRNWKWAVPTGCLGILVLSMCALALVFGLIFGIMRSSGAYQDALARAKASPALQAALGTPIESGYFISGNIQVNGASGRASLAIPISGPKGKATLYVEATKSAGQWGFSTLTAQLRANRQRIDLLSEAGTPPLVEQPAEAPGG